MPSTFYVLGVRHICAWSMKLQVTMPITSRSTGYISVLTSDLVPGGTSPTISQVDNLQAMSKMVQEFILFYLLLTGKTNKSGNL